MLANINLAVLVVVQRRQRNVQKNVMHVQSCCFACLNPLLFLLFSLLSPSWLRKLANILPQRARESTLIVVIIDI